MSSTIERVRAAFADEYEVEREIGAGGMATVYLARELKHDRQVAIKVLKPELAAALGPDRFPREIKIAAQPKPGMVTRRQDDRVRVGAVGWEVGDCQRCGAAGGELAGVLSLPPTHTGVGGRGSGFGLPIPDSRLP